MVEPQESCKLINSLKEILSADDAHYMVYFKQQRLLFLFVFMSLI